MEETFSTFRGLDEWPAYLKALQEEQEQAMATISPGGAALLLGVARQRVHELLHQKEASVRAWAYYEGRLDRAGYVEISVLDLLLWGLKVGRIKPGDDLPYLGRRWEARVEALTGKSVLTLSEGGAILCK